jgi:hypothetical protein
MGRHTDTVDNKEEKKQEVLFYYGYVQEHRYTTCMILEGDKYLARGVAICSMRDQFNKKKGRMIAEGRARKALALGHSFGPINRDIFPLYTWGTPKGELYPQLTMVEIELLDRKHNGKATYVQIVETTSQLVMKKGSKSPKT